MTEFYDGQGADFYLTAVKNNKERKEKELANQIKRHKETRQCCGVKKDELHSIICVNYDEELGYKNRFVQHYPAFFSVDDTDYFTLNFNTQDELLNCEFVSRWNKDRKDDKFHRYSIDPPAYGMPAMLMVEYNEGKEWVCIGKIKTTDGLNLSKWEPVYEKKE